MKEYFKYFRNININMSGKIYLISKDGKPKYVGFTSRSIEERWEEHCAHADGKRKSKLYSAIRKYGNDTFTIELIADYINEDFALTVCEEFWIRHLGTHVDEGGYNMTYGGDVPPSWKGRKHSDEAKLKIKQARAKQTPPRLGKSHSEETKQKMSVAKKGRLFTSEHRSKLSLAARNRHNQHKGN